MLILEASLDEYMYGLVTNELSNFEQGYQVCRILGEELLVDDRAYLGWECGEQRPSRMIGIGKSRSRACVKDRHDGSPNR